jgi:hypothetical protein
LPGHAKRLSATELSKELRRNEKSGGPHIDARAVTDRTGLSLPGDLPLTDWCDIGTQLLAVNDSSSWWIGDWLVFGNKKYPDRYHRAMSDTSLDYQTLRNYAWVAGAFEPSRRRAELTFQHHMEVAALPQDEQDHWLEFAVRLQWSRNVLRKHVRVNRRMEREGDYRSVSLQLDLTQERYLRWTEAAEQHNTKLQDWIVSVLDHAVSDRSMS